MSKIYSVGRFSERIGRSPSTLRRWDREGRLKAKRLPSGHRYYDETDVRIALGGPMQVQRVVVYCRVSSSGQKDDLKTQVEAMERFCLSGSIAVDEWITEIAGGMNFKRKQFLRIMAQIQAGEIGRLLIAHKDRLVRFGFDYFEHMAGENGCVITVANQESLSPQQEMVEDLLTIVHTFSCRLYGLRKYTSKLREDLIVSSDSHSV